MTDNQYYRLNPNSTSYNQQNYPGRLEVNIQGSEMAQYSPPSYVIIILKIGKLQSFVIELPK